MYYINSLGRNQCFTVNSVAAKNGIDWYSGGVVGILNPFIDVISNIIKLAGVFTIILIGCPWLLPVQIVAVGVMTYFNTRTNKMQVENFKKMSKLNRVFGYYNWDITNPVNGKDIRLYASDEMMLAKVRKYNRNTGDILKNRQGSQFCMVSPAIYLILSVMVLHIYISAVCQSPRLYQ